MNVSDFLLAAGFDPHNLLLVGGVLVVIIVLMRMTRRQQARAAQQADGPADRTQAAHAAHSVREQLDELMVQLEELARATNGQIETRFTKLEVVLREADQKIARLESLLTQLDGRLPAPPPTPQVRPEHQQVYDLADAGKGAVDIARDLARPVGEVELILALRKKN